MKQSIILPLTILFFHTSILSQQSNRGSVTGQIVDESTRKPIEFVNTSVHTKTDSILAAGTVTDEKGKFEITDIPFGEYFVKMSILGFKEKKSVSFRIDAQRRKANLGMVGLSESVVNMSEVIVSAEKTTFTNSIDRKVYNVEQDVISKAGSAGDLLQNIPSIEVDIDGNVSLRGSGSVLILINGKTSALMQRSSATVLQQMPANAIEKIEVITNPSAKYKPDGTSGIINIVLKKNQELGFNGNAGLAAGTSDRYGANGRLNFNPGDFNLHGSYSVRKDNRNRSTAETRMQTDVYGASKFFRSELLSSGRPVSHMAELGLDYELDDNNSMAAGVNYFTHDVDRLDNSDQLITNAASSLIGDDSRHRVIYESEKEYGVTLSYEHAFPEKDHTLQAEYRREQTAESEDNRYTNFYRTPAAPVQYENTMVKEEEGKDEVTVEYSNPISEDIKVEAGYGGEFNARVLDNAADSLDRALQQLITYKDKTNRFEYNDAVHAVHATYERSFGSFGFLAGVRAEYSLLRSHLFSPLLVRDSTVENNYFSLFPTIHFSYELEKGIELQLNYSKRTRRPEGDDLNPFPEYRDPRNISSGNPKLLPEYIHSIEAGCKFEDEMFSFLPSMYYRYTYNRFTSVTSALSDTLLLTTLTNLSKDESAGVEAIVSASVNSFSAHASANVFNNTIDATNLGYGKNKSVVTWSGALTCSFNFFYGSMLQVNSNYSSERLTPQGRTLPSYIVNLGYRQEFFGRELALAVTITDVFRTQRRENRLEIPGLQQTAVSTRDTRVVMLGLSYNFGTQTKREDDKLKYDDSI